MNSYLLFSIIMRGKAASRRKNFVRSLAIIFVGLLIIAIALAEYFGFVGFFRSLDSLTAIKPIVIAYSLQSLFFLLFILITASTLITGPFIFLNKKDINFLLPLPLKNLILFRAHFWQEISGSLLIALIFGVPAIFALLTLPHSSILLLPYGLIFFVVLVILAVTLGNILLLLTFTLTRRFSFRFNFLLIAVLVGILVYILSRTVIPKDIFQILVANNPEGNDLALANIHRLYAFWPSGWYVNGLLKELSYTPFTGFGGLWITLLTFICLVFQALLAKYSYRKILQTSQENLEKIDAQKNILTKFSGSSLLIAKEISTLIRNRRDLAQFILFIFLLAMYVSFILGTKTINVNSDPVWTPRITMFIIIALIYFINLLGLRFVYPQTSTELTRSWFFFALPKFRKNNFSTRIIAWTIFTVVIIEIMVMVTTSVFNYNNRFTLPLMFIIPFITIFIMTLSNFFGTYFPVQEKNEPESLSTTSSGLSLFVLVSIYTFAVVYGLGFEARNAIANGSNGINIGLIYLLIIIGSTLITIGLWKTGEKRYQKMYLG